MKYKYVDLRDRTDIDRSYAAAARARARGRVQKKQDRSIAKSIAHLDRTQIKVSKASAQRCNNDAAYLVDGDPVIATSPIMMTAASGQLHFNRG